MSSNVFELYNIEQFGNLLLVITFILLLAPYIGGIKLGLVDIPKFPPAIRKKLKLFGPVSFILVFALHIVELEFRAMRGSQVCIEEHSSPRRVEYR